MASIDCLLKRCKSTQISFWSYPDTMKTSYLFAWEYSESPTQWPCPPLHHPSSWGISRCIQHCFAKCFSHSFLAAWMGSWALKDHFTLRIAWVLERELKGVGLMASRKLQATWDPPLVLLPWSYDWQLWCRNWVVPLPAEAALALWFMEAATERRAICDKTSSLCCTSWHFPRQMYHSPSKISSHVANCSHCKEWQQPGM